MVFPASISTTELQLYHDVMGRAIEVRSHFDMLVWLQGDFQRYLPHDMLIATWGNFESKNLYHDVISPIPGVRSQRVNSATVTSLMLGLFQRWREFQKQPYALRAGSNGFMNDGAEHGGKISKVLLKMQNVLVHGIIDERGKHNCLYAAFSTKTAYGTAERSAMASMLPYVDTALRQIAHLPHQNEQTVGVLIASATASAHGLSDRESEVLQWVAKGKTNSEIAKILDISAFTVKNHMQRVFQKLDVTNRAQAVSKLSAMPSKSSHA